MLRTRKTLWLAGFLLSTFCFLLSPRAADLQVLTITVVDTPANGDTLTVNGSTRTWTNALTSPSTQILVGTNTIGSNATNLFRSFGSAPIRGITPQRYGTNAVRLLAFPGQSLTASSSGAWATIGISTNTDSPGFAVRVPMSSQEPIASQRENVSSILITDLSTYPTNAFPQSAPVLTNFVNTGLEQIIDGSKTFTGANVHSNVDNYFDGGVMTNQHVKFVRTAWRSSADVGLLGWYHQDSNDVSTVAIAPSATGRPSIYDVTATDYPSIAAAYDPDPENALNAAMGDGRYGRLAGNNVWPGDNTFSSILDSTTTSTFTLNSDMAWRRLNIDSLANGPNAAIPIGTSNTFIKLLTGPSAEFSTDGFASGRDGRFIVVENGTSGPYTWTIPNESGLEPIPENRILTRSGSPVTVSGRAMAEFLYDGEASRWVLISISDTANGTIWVNDGGIYRPLQAQFGLVATNMQSVGSFSALGAFSTPPVLSTNLHAGLNEINPFQAAYILLTGYSSDPSEANVTLFYGNGSGSHLWIENYGAGFGFSITNNTPLADDPSHLILLSQGDWFPTENGETMHLLQDPHGDWREQERAFSSTNVFQNLIIRSNLTVNGQTVVMLATKGDLLTHDSSNEAILPVGSNGQVLTADSAQTKGIKWSTPGSGTAINPTDGWIPYRFSSGAFSNSPLYRISGTRIGFGGTNTFAFSDGSANLGLGTYSASSITSGNGNTLVGQAAGYRTSSGNNNSFHGQGAGYYVTSGSRNVFVGAQTGGSATVESDNILIGTFSGINNPGITNAIVIANSPDGLSGARATNSNEIVLGNANSTRIFIPMPVIPTYTPSSSSEANYVGAITWDASYIYVWTAANVNKRVALSTW